MIATLHPYGQVWVPAGKPSLMALRSVPFAVPGVVCVCHTQTWIKDTASGLLTVVRWYD